MVRPFFCINLAIGNSVFLIGYFFSKKINYLLQIFAYFFYFLLPHSSGDVCSNFHFMHDDGDEIFKTSM